MTFEIANECQWLLSSKLSDGRMSEFLKEITKDEDGKEKVILRGRGTTLCSLGEVYDYIEGERLRKAFDGLLRVKL